MVKATPRPVYGAEAIDDGVSGDYLVNEIARVAESLETLVEPRDWAMFQTLTLATMAVWLIATAGRVQLRKQPRATKKPPVLRTHDPHRPHLSVARLLALRQSAKQATTP